MKRSSLVSAWRWVLLIIILRPYGSRLCPAARKLSMHFQATCFHSLFIVLPILHSSILAIHLKNGQQWKWSILIMYPMEWKPLLYPAVAMRCFITRDPIQKALLFFNPYFQIGCPVQGIRSTIGPILKYWAKNTGTMTQARKRKFGYRSRGSNRFWKTLIVAVNLSSATLILGLLTRFRFILIRRIFIVIQ